MNMSDIDSNYDTMSISSKSQANHTSKMDYGRQKKKWVAIIKTCISNAKILVISGSMIIDTIYWGRQWKLELHLHCGMDQQSLPGWSCGLECQRGMWPPAEQM